MNGLQRSRMWRNLKQRLGLKGMGCCGALWSLGTQTITIMQQEEEEGTHMQNQQRTYASGINLATALQAERNIRGRNNVGRNETVGPGVKTLMMLIEETDGEDWKKKKTEVVGEGNDWMCCVCMERNKGAAFIPCGHTFCRDCSKEIWLNRGSCPICNRSILQILDIF